MSVFSFPCSSFLFLLARVLFFFRLFSSSSLLFILLSLAVFGWLMFSLFSSRGVVLLQVGSGRVESSQIELVSGSCFSGFFILFAVFHLFSHGNLLSLYDISR